MSRQISPSNKYRGRYNMPMATSNLVTDDNDFPEFEPSEGEATPRGYAPDEVDLWVEKVDMCQETNKEEHSTTDYDIENLVVRRGQKFLMKITFNRKLTHDDDFQLEFEIGSNPLPIENSLEVVTFNYRRGGSWSGKKIVQQDETVELEIKTTAKAIVGKYNTYVSIVTSPNTMRKSIKDTTTDLYLLFNAWCEDDTVYMAEDQERREYVLNDVGVIYRGSVGHLTKRNWVYGQFERGVLDACITILDSSQMLIKDRGHVIKVIRKGSAMINSQDDSGVLVGNWSNNFALGTSPGAWIGSVRILLQYANTGIPVCFAQCWVFAGVFNTFLRCLGIPARVVTNLSSAHDNTGNLKTDIIFRPDLTSDRRNTRDSIWNYHCWNEVCMKRSDLPPGLGGWQVVDATPQETSGGYYRCGPASVAAIKDGLLCHPFDCEFVFAEVNSDVVYHILDKYGVLTPFMVNTTYIGQGIYTKAIGSREAEEITENYKYPEGSDADTQAMAKAEDFDCARDHSVLTDAKLVITVSAEKTSLGQDLNVDVDFQNQDEVTRTVKAHLSGLVVLYTGIMAKSFKDQDFTVVVPPYQTERLSFRVAADDYLPHLDSQLSMQFVVTGQVEDKTVTDMIVVELQCPELTLEVSGLPYLHRQMFVTVSFTNPLTIPLHGIKLVLEGNGVLPNTERSFGVVEGEATVSWKEPFSPWRRGNRCIVALMHCHKLDQVTGYICFKVSA